MCLSLCALSGAFKPPDGCSKGIGKRKKKQVGITEKYELIGFIQQSKSAQFTIWRKYLLVLTWPENHFSSCVNKASSSSSDFSGRMYPETVGNPSMLTADHAYFGYHSSSELKVSFSKLCVNSFSFSMEVFLKMVVVIQLILYSMEPSCVQLY